MRRGLVALLVVMGLAIPTAAFAIGIRADDQSSSQDDDGNWRPGEDPSQTRHNHLHELYDDVTGIMIPPIAIKPGQHPDPHFYPLPELQNPDALIDQQNLLPDNLVDSLTGINDSTSQFKTTTLSNAQVTKLNINPNQNKPVQVKNLLITQRTPSDEFTQNALYLGSALGLVAFGLVAFTGLQSRRYRKKSKN